MITTTQAAPVSPVPRSVASAPQARNPTPPSPPSHSAASGTGVVRRRGKLGRWLLVLALLILGVGGGLAWAECTGTDLNARVIDAWRKLTESDVPEGFAMTNGRLEATKVYVTTKFQGRIESVLVREGDAIEAGQVLAHMDTRTLQAQLRQAEAHIQKAKDAKTTAEATVAQRKAELEFWNSEVQRERQMLANRATSQMLFEGVTSKWLSAKAALQVAGSQVIEAQAAIAAAVADADRLRVDINDGILVAPRRGRVQYRMAEPGEVLAPGGRVLDTIDLTDVYMLCYLSEADAGKATIGAEARLVFDAIPDVVIPATVYFVAAEAQFTPKAVETRTERQKLAFQVRARIDSALLMKYEPYVRTGLPGVIYVRLDPRAQWPDRLRINIPETVGTKR
jgi:HlyD family secretion protein